jgi:hypothetical protein
MESTYTDAGEIALLMSCAMPGHLAQCAQAFVFEHGGLGALLILVSLLQRSVQLRLVGRQRDVVAELAQEFTFAAAEGLRATPRDHEHGEHAARIHAQRHDDHGAHAGARQALREWVFHRGHIGLVHELPLHAARQTVVVDFDARLFCHGQLERELLAARTNATHHQRRSPG